MGEEDTGQTAYIGIKREANVTKYIAKVFGAPPAEITKAEYDHIVKLLNTNDWKNAVGDEAVIVSQIINSVLKQPNENDSDELPESAG